MTVLKVVVPVIIVIALLIFAVKYNRREREEE